jgi:hypothetical protein
VENLATVQDASSRRLYESWYMACCGVAVATAGPTPVPSAAASSHSGHCSLRFSDSSVRRLPSSPSVPGGSTSPAVGKVVAPYGILLRSGNRHISSRSRTMTVNLVSGKETEATDRGIRETGEVSGPGRKSRPEERLGAMWRGVVPRILWQLRFSS